MELTAFITYEQYRDAYAAIKPSPTQLRATQRILTPAVSAFAGIMLIYVPTTRNLFFWMLALYAPLVFAVQRWSRARYDGCLRELFDRNKDAMNGQKMKVDELGISGSGGENAFSYSYKWSAFQRCIEVPDGYLFLPTPDTFVRIPFESLSIEQRRQILVWSSSISHSLRATKE